MIPNHQQIGLMMLAIAGVVGGVASLAYRQSASALSFIMAQETWAARQPSHYRMTVEQDGLGGFPICQQQVEVKDETIVRVLSNTCESGDISGEPLTISQIFALFRADAIDRTCGPNGCSCDGIIQVDATYDPIVGYPRWIETKLVPDWLNVSYWQVHLTGGACTLIGLRNSRVAIVAFESLP
jgi:hypothetical protein